MLHNGPPHYSNDAYAHAKRLLEIHSIATDHNYRRCGYAKKLMTNVLQKAKLLGANKAFLDVRESNVFAIGFYKSLGFKEFSIRKNYYSNLENALQMKCEF